MSLPRDDYVNIMFAAFRLIIIFINWYRFLFGEYEKNSADPKNWVWGEGNNYRWLKCIIRIFLYSHRLRFFPHTVCAIIFFKNSTKYMLVNALEYAIFSLSGWKSVSKWNDIKWRNGTNLVRIGSAVRLQRGKNRSKRAWANTLKGVAFQSI